MLFGYQGQDEDFKRFMLRHWHSEIKSETGFLHRESVWHITVFKVDFKSCLDVNHWEKISNLTADRTALKSIPVIRKRPVLIVNTFILVVGY